MGNSCCHQNGHQRTKAAYHTAGDRSVHRRPASSVAPSGNGSGNPGLSSGQQEVHTQGTQEGIMVTPKKIQIERTEDQHVAPVTSAATANQVDEHELHILKSSEDENVSSDCRLVADDACKEAYKSDLLLTIDDEGDFCPTCLEGYDEENPMILTKCKHRYHLACILEWMERSNTCPMCDKEMEFEETS